MVTTTRSREVRYDVSDDFELPEIATVSPLVNRTLEQDRLDLRSVYYDTAGLDLLRAGVTLRHREGLAHPGWQLKIAERDLPVEIDSSQFGASVPQELQDLLAGVLRGRSLRAEVALHIRRDIRRMVDADGHVLATLYDDAVDLTPENADSVASRWREVDVELGDAGDEEFLERLAGCLTGAGASESGRASKLTHAVHGLAPGESARGEQAATAGEIVVAYLSSQYVALLHHDISLRAHLDAYREARANVRRVRSTLRVFGDLFSAERVEALDVELSWLAGLLRDACHAANVRARISSQLVRIRSRGTSERTTTGLVQAAESDVDRQRSGVARALVSSRYAALLDALAGFLESPPATDAYRDSPELLANLARAARRSATRRLRSADLAAADEVSIRRLRKAIDRANDGRDALRSSPAARGRSERDFAELRELIREHTRASATARFATDHARATPGEGFAWGLVFAAEMSAADRTREQIRVACAALLNA